MAEWRKVTEWWTSVPAVTRLVVFALPVLLMLDILFNVFGYLVNDAYATLLCYQKPERTKGSTRYAVSLVVNSNAQPAFLAQLLFDVLTLLLSLVPGLELLRRYPCYGLWPVIICEICVKCWEHPDTVIHPCGLPIGIKSKFYPFVFVGLFTLLFWGAAFELGIGLAIGYLSRG